MSKLRRDFQRIHHEKPRNWQDLPRCSQRRRLMPDTFSATILSAGTVDLRDKKTKPKQKQQSPEEKNA